jgi:hypothetical protein
MTINWSEIINQTIAQILAAVAIFILSFFVLDQKKVVQPWIYRYFNNTLRVVILFVLTIAEILISTPARVLISLVLLALVNIYGGLYYSVILSLMILTFLLQIQKRKKFLPVSEYSDEFKNLDSWEIVRGSPIIEGNFGKPVPDLLLKFTGDNPTNSLVIHKQTKIQQGVIECDVYLEPNAVFNIAFLADKEKEKWYMARFDSRPSESDGFLVKDEGKGMQNWNYFQMSGTHTSVHEWHRMKIVIKDKIVALFKNDEKIVEFSNPELFGTNIGLFNEVNDVHIDNFSYTKNLWD